MIANRWRILLTRYELRTLLLLAPALLTFELCQLAGRDREGLDRELGRGGGGGRRDLPGIARERREWAGQRRFGDGRMLEGGDLPFHPRLLSGPPRASRRQRGLGGGDTSTGASCAASCATPRHRPR